jgi:hypothetical protein
MYSKYASAPPTPKFGGNKEAVPAYIEVMDEIFLVHGTTHIIAGQYRGAYPVRPVQTYRMSNDEYKERREDWRAACHDWKKADTKDTEQAGLSRSAFHSSLEGLAKSMMSTIMDRDRDMGGNLIPMQQRLHDEWRAFIDLFLPKIEDYANISKERISLVTDAGGIPFLNSVYVNNLTGITKMAKYGPPPEKAYKIVNGHAVLAPELMICPHLPTDETLRSMYLRAIKDTHYLPTKARLEHEKASFQTCMRDMTAAYESRANNESFENLRGQLRTDGHPFSNALEAQASMAHLARHDAPIYPTQSLPAQGAYYRRDQQAIPPDFSVFQSQVLASQGTDYRRDQAGYYDDRNYDRGNDRTTSRGNDNSRGYDNYRGNDNFRANDQPRQSNGWNSRQRIECYNCGKIGHTATDCNNLTCNTCGKSWESVNSNGRHTSANCPTRSPVRGRSGSRDRNSRDRSRDRNTESNTFSNANSSGRPPSPRNQSSSSQPYPRPGTPARDNGN